MIKNRLTVQLDLPTHQRLAGLQGTGQTKIDAFRELVRSKVQPTSVDVETISFSVRLSDVDWKILRKKAFNARMTLSDTVRALINARCNL